jgi:hypothetical protein
MSQFSLCVVQFCQGNHTETYQKVSSQSLLNVLDSWACLGLYDWAGDRLRYVPWPNLAQNPKRPDFKCLSQGSKIDKVILMEDNTFLDQLNAAKPIIQWDFRLLGWHSCIQSSKVTNNMGISRMTSFTNLKNYGSHPLFASWGISS